jgi:UDP-N-acetylmuramate dehydrogenase
MNEPQQGLKIKENVPLAPLTTLKIGGAARFFVRAETESHVTAAFKFAEENGFDLFILGGGSNVLISDKGFDGLVLQIALRGITVKEDSVTAQAGEDWDEFVAFCVGRNLAGVECLSGIPGLVGGTPVQNVGAYGQEVSETIVSVRVFDRRSDQILELTNKDCKFSYRTSIFNSTDKNRFIVLAVTYQLKEGGEPKIVYKDLHEYFGEKSPTLEETREAV